MSNRSDLAIAFSKDGWVEFRDHVDNALDSVNQEQINDLISFADKSLIHTDGSRLLYWQYVKTYSGDMLSLMNAVNSVDENQYYTVELEGDGSEENYGVFYDNVFGISVNRSIFINEDHCEDIDVGVIQPSKSPIVPLVVAMVNDIHCPSCGNDKCSSQEKSCWKCGGKL